MNCKRCGRGLKNPKSIERGFGPVCWKKQDKKEEKKYLDLGDFFKKTEVKK